MYRRLGYGSIPGYAPCCLDSNDPLTVQAGFEARVARSLPVADPNELEALGKFVDKFLEERVPKVRVLDFEEWLASTPYPEERKSQLREAHEALRGGAPTTRQCQHIDSFIKTEFYPTLKPPRWINSRSDAFKVYSGPAFKAIEEAVYSLPQFIKHVPVAERPAKISKLQQAGRRYYGSDYTAFESHLIADIMKVLELKLYKWCLSDYPDLAARICRTIGGVNKMRTRTGCRASVKAKRMSGDMCTSLGNGFSNLMLVMYIVTCKGGQFEGFVEGDDCIFATDVAVTADDFLKLGFTIKIEEFASPNEASFCGMIYSTDGQILKDPRKVFQGFGWTHSYINAGPRIMDELLKAKALSLAYEAPQCPIVGVLARCALERTARYTPRYVADGYHSQPPVFALDDFHPSVEARQLFSRVYGVSVSEQLLVESLIRSGRLHDIAAILPPNNANATYSLNFVEVS